MVRTYLKAAAFLLLPLVLGAVLLHQLIADPDVWDRWQRAIGLVALFCLFLASLRRELCRVVTWLPDEIKLSHLLILVAYVFAAAHAGFFLAAWHADWRDIYTDSAVWMAAWLAGIAAFALLLAAPVRRLLLSGAPSSRWLLFIIAVLALAHGMPAGSALGFNHNYDPGNWYNTVGDKLNLGVYAISIFLAVWIFLAIAARFKVRFTSPIPRFSLLTLLLIPCAGFSAAVLHKHWLPWSYERSLAEHEEITNPWGAFVDPVSTISPDGRFAVTSIENGPTLFWDCQTGQSQDLGTNYKSALVARFSPDGRYFALIARARVFYKREHDEAINRILRVEPPPAPNAPEEEKKDGQIFTSPSDTEVLYLFETKSRRLIAPLTTGNHYEIDFHFSRDSLSLLAFSFDRFAVVFDTRSGDVLSHHALRGVLETPSDPDEPPWPRCIRFQSATGTRVLLDHPDPMFGEFGIYTPAMHKILQRLPMELPFNRSCFTPDGALLLVSKSPAVLEAIRVTDGSLAWSKDLNSDNVKEDPAIFAHFDDDKFFVSLPTRLEVLRVSDGKSLETLPAVNLNPGFSTHSQKALLIADSDGNRRSVAVFDWKTREAGVLVSDERTDSPRPISIGTHTLSDDGCWILQCGSKGSVRLWKKRYPPAWWGRATLPEFWTTLFFTAALLWSILRDRRQNLSSTAAGAPART